jgi:hypothetical protein
MPQVTAEIVVPLETSDRNDRSNSGRAWALIPGSGETAFGTQPYTDINGYLDNDGALVELVRKLGNVHNPHREPDLIVSVNQLMAEQPGLETISLVVSWFGTDLRAGECLIIPKVEDNSRRLQLVDWGLAGLTYATAEEVSNQGDETRPWFGGTPSDETLREAIRYLKANGARVMLCPFLLMDVPPGNTLPNPYSDNASEVGQAVFPWRGRITCAPAAPTRPRRPRTRSRASSRADGYRRFILHYAAALRLARWHDPCGF